MLHFQYSPSFADRWEAHRAHRRQHRWRGRTTWIIGGTLVLLLFSFQVVLYVREGRWQMGAFVLPAIYVLLLVLNPLVERVQLQRRWRRDPRNEEIIEMELTEDGIHYCATLLDMTIRWGQFTHFIETDTMFLLYMSRDQYMYLAMSAMADGQEQQVRQLLEERIGATVFRQAARAFPVVVLNQPEPVAQPPATGAAESGSGEAPS